MSALARLAESSRNGGSTGTGSGGGGERRKDKWDRHNSNSRLGVRSGAGSDGNASGASGGGTGGGGARYQNNINREPRNNNRWSGSSDNHHNNQRRGRETQPSSAPRTNSRWDVQEEAGHGKIAKPASKESLKQSWAQIRAARQAKMTSQSNNKEPQNPQNNTTASSISGLGALAARTSNDNGGRRNGRNNARYDTRHGSAPATTTTTAAAAAASTTTTTTSSEPPPRNMEEPKETIQLREYFSTRSSIFRDWEKTRSDGWTNTNVANFFDKKKTSHDNEKQKGKKGHGTDMRRIGQLFNRFYSYAHDINNGTNYVERALKICQMTGSCDFLDFGFAPGGMSHLLLSQHPGMRGSGVTLDPNQGGNVWPDWLNHDRRFYSCVGDVVDMARNEQDLPQLLQLPKDFTGFDFVIVGITIHQGHLLGLDEKEGGILGHANELKDRLHFAQLYFAFKYLKPGGMVLMRHLMSVRLVDYHFLSLMLSLFNPDKYAVTNVIQRQQKEQKEKEQGNPTNPTTTSNPTTPTPPTTTAATVTQDARSSDGKQQVTLKPAIIATKPMAEFAIRKTYWVVYQGFDAKSCQEKDVLNMLLEMLGQDTPNEGPYSLSEPPEEEKESEDVEGVNGVGKEKGADQMEGDVESAKILSLERKYYMPNLCGRGVSLEDTLSKYGERAIAVLETVWNMQVVALKGFMDGKKDRMCKYGTRGCRQYQRGRCHMAHYPEEMVEECWLALNAIPQDSPYQSSY